jgi:hypothetical protein
LPYPLTIQLIFLPYFPTLITIQLTFLPYFPYLFTIQLIFLPYFSYLFPNFFHIFNIISQFSSAFSISFHYSTGVSSVF